MAPVPALPAAAACASAPVGGFPSLKLGGCAKPRYPGGGVWVLFQLGSGGGDRKPRAFPPSVGAEGSRPPQDGLWMDQPGTENRALLVHPSPVRSWAHWGLVPGGWSLSPLLGETVPRVGWDPADRLGPGQDCRQSLQPEQQAFSFTDRGSFVEEAVASVLTSLNTSRPPLPLG